MRKIMMKDKTNNHLIKVVDGKFGSEVSITKIDDPAFPMFRLYFNDDIKITNDFEDESQSKRLVNDMIDILNIVSSKNGLASGEIIRKQYPAAFSDSIHFLDGVKIFAETVVGSDVVYDEEDANRIIELITFTQHVPLYPERFYVNLGNVINEIINSPGNGVMIPLGRPDDIVIINMNEDVDDEAAFKYGPFDIEELMDAFQEGDIYSYVYDMIRSIDNEIKEALCFDVNIVGIV